jgi:hypothetical protein
MYLSILDSKYSVSVEYGRSNSQNSRTAISSFSFFVESTTPSRAALAVPKIFWIFRRFGVKRLHQALCTTLYVGLQYFTGGSHVGTDTYCIFGPLKQHLGGRRFHIKKAVEVGIREWLSM